MALYRSAAVRMPSLEELTKISERLNLKLDESQLKEYMGLMTAFLPTYDLVDSLPAPTLPVKYPRTPGHQPEAEDNKFNAWYYKTDIPGASAGLLAGKKLAIKDAIAVAGVPMMNGSRMVEGYVPEYDATVVTRVLDAGGHIMGKSVCNDMCIGGLSAETAGAPVLNPRDVMRSAGGSSSGSAALIASGEVDMALGGDQAGSIRLPASYCGIVGLKPTYGLVPYTGACTLDPSCDTLGPMAATVKDCATLLQAIAGYDENDGRQHPGIEVPDYTAQLTGDLKGLKVALLEEGFDQCEEDVTSLVKEGANLLTKAGAVVEDASLPIHKLAEAIYVPLAVDGIKTYFFDQAGCAVGLPGFQSSTLVDHISKSGPSKMSELSASVRFMALFGQYVQDNHRYHYYAKCQSMIGGLRKSYDALLDKYDVIVMPTARTKAPLLPEAGASISERVGSSITVFSNTCPFNITGHPAISINAAMSEGLPVGMMIVGRQFEDATVLKVAHAYEQLRGDNN